MRSTIPLFVFVSGTLLGCDATLSSIASPSASSDTADSATVPGIVINGTTSYQEHTLEHVNVGLLYVVTDGESWGNIDAPIVVDETNSAAAGTFAVGTDQLSSYWLIGEIGRDEFSGILASYTQLELDDWGQTITTNIVLEEITHYDDSSYATSCTCELRWSHLSYSCCPSATGEVCSWLWNNCLNE